MSDPNHFEAGNLDVHEFRQILARRVKALADESLDPSQPDQPIRQALDDVRKSVPPHERNLIGLALSGGGIRSATFGLGVIQGLAELGLLKFVDYLSTVSGGGYIGGWLAAWIKREGGLENVSKQLRPKRTDQAEADRGFQDDPPRLKPGTVCDDEPEPIAHLREFSNYLSPKMSLFSADSWTLIAIYLRNLLANQLVLLPMVLALLMGVRALAAFFSWPALCSVWGLVLGILSCLGFLACFWLITYSVTLVSDRSTSETTGPATGPTWFFWTIALVFLESILLTWLLVPITNCDAPAVTLPCHWKLPVGQWAAVIRPEHPVVFNGYQLLLLSVVFGSLHGAFNLLHWNFTRIAFGVASGAIAGTVLYLALHFVLWPNWQNPEVIITWGPPLMLLIITLANVLEAAFPGRQAEEQEREWRSRFNAWLMILAAGWTLIFALSLQGSHTDRQN